MTRLKTLLPIIGVAVFALVGWLATNALQQSSSPSSEYRECWSHDAGFKRIACLSERFEADVTRATGGLTGREREERLLAVVRDAESAAADDTMLAGTCHPAMHQIGRDEGGRAARMDYVPSFPAGSSQLCTAGYVHGLAEGYLVGTPEADVASVFPALCHDENAREGCAHGVGHALLRARVDEPATPAAMAATRRCGDLPGDFPTNCMNGVYMELAMRTQPAPVRPVAYAKACSSAQDPTESLSCWGYMGLNLSTNDVPLADVPSWCAKADLPGQFICIDEYGRDLGVKGVAQCEGSGSSVALDKRCIEGAIGLQVGSGHVEAAEAVEACRGIEKRSLALHCEGAVERYERGRRQVESA